MAIGVFLVLATLLHSASLEITEHVMRAKLNPQKARFIGVCEIVSGRKNLSKSSRRSRGVILKVSHKDMGKVLSQSRGMNRDRASFQKALWTKFSSHHLRHLSKVRRSICNDAAKAWTRLGVRPLRIAEIRMMRKPG